MKTYFTKHKSHSKQDLLKHVMKKVRGYANMGMGILYPQKCPICNKIMGTGQCICCDTCEKELPFIGETRCLQCGKPVDDEETQYCMDCIKKEHIYCQGIALWYYDYRIRQAVYRFKYKNRREYVSYFGKEIVRRYAKQIKVWNAQALIPVPLHKSRYRQRGFNQAQLLAEEISRFIHVPVYTSLVVRSKATKPQKELNEKERQKNLKNAFKINENSVKLKRVVLVDDIYTTGSTVDTIAQLLHGAGIEQVYVISLCIGKGY